MMSIVKPLSLAFIVSALMMAIMSNAAAQTVCVPLKPEAWSEACEANDPWSLWPSNLADSPYSTVLQAQPEGAVQSSHTESEFSLLREGLRPGSEPTFDNS